MPSYILTYFPLGGVALPARLMFTLADVAFTDVRIPFAEWSQLKEDNERFPLNQLPTLQIDDETICQSNAINRYLGNEFGFYGTSNTDKVNIDQICETFIDHGIDAKKIMFDRSLTDEQKKAKYEEYFTGEVFLKRLTFLTKILKKHENGEKYFVGDKLSIADFVFLQLDVLISLFYPADYLQKHPELRALIERIKSFDKIKNYLEENKDSITTIPS